MAIDVRDAATARKATDAANGFSHETAVPRALDKIGAAAKAGKACVRMYFVTVEEFRIVVDGLRGLGFEVDTNPNRYPQGWSRPVPTIDDSTSIEVRW